MRAAELILLGQSFGALRATELGLVTSVVPDQKLLATATETAQTLAAKPAGAVQACKQLMKSAFRDQLEQAVKLENQVFAARGRSDEAKEAIRALFANRKAASSGQGSHRRVWCCDAHGRDRHCAARTPDVQSCPQ